MSSSSWTQVYITGLNRSILPSNEDIEIALDLQYRLSSIICSSCSGSTKLIQSTVGGVEGDEKKDAEIDAEGRSRGWAGYGTTIIKRLTNTDCCRGYAFLSFFTREAALVVIERINSEYNNHSNNECIHGVSTQLPELRAEMVNVSSTSSSTPATKEKKQRNSNNKKKDNEVALSLLPDLRLKRQRKKPIGKHPVIISSNGRRTNLGNKTK